MEDLKKNVKSEKDHKLSNELDKFLDNKSKSNKECEGDECYINDGKEIVERIEKKLITTDGRRLLI